MGVQNSHAYWLSRLSLASRISTTRKLTRLDQAPTRPSQEEFIRQDERISELESRLEFQDETIQKLSDEMVQLQGKLFAQDKQLKRLMDRLQAAAGDEDGADPNQVEPPPPHY